MSSPNASFPHPPRVVTKQLNARHPAGHRFLASAAQCGIGGMMRYLDTLRAVGVRLPEDLQPTAAEPLIVRHRWVDGPTLLEAAATQPRGFADAVGEVAAWVRELDRTDARIDTNLANFCLSHGRPFLVDVLPPLIPSLRPAPHDLFDELFHALCFDTPVTLNALIGYSLRALLRSGNSGEATRLLPLAHQLVTANDEAGFPARWFDSRARLAIRAAEGDEPAETVTDFFTLTSILAFGHLTETARRRRLDEVRHRTEELAL